MRLILLASALLLILLILLLYIYWRDHRIVEPEPLIVVPPSYQRRTHAYEFTPNIDFNVIARSKHRKRPKHRRRHTQVIDESSEFSSDTFSDSSETYDSLTSTDESMDTFEERDEHIIIVNGPDEIRQLVHLVQGDILRDFNAQAFPIGEPLFEPARRRRNRNEETAEEFFRDMNDHNDDGQNVHNPQIRKALTNRLLRIIELNGGVHGTYTVGGLELSHEQYYKAKFTQTDREIRDRNRQYHDGLVLREVINREEADLRIQKVDMVLKKVSHGYDLLMTDNKVYKEDFILVQVWDRINHVNNFANREQLQIALIDNLVDSVEERQAPIATLDGFINTLLGNNPSPTGLGATHMTVCINGRVARVLTSLVLLDADEQVAAPEKDEKEYMNEALYKVSRLLDRELDTYEVKLPETDKTMRDIYEEPDEDKLSQRERLVLRTFENHIREVMAEEIHQDYNGILPPDQITGIIEKVHAGI